MTFVIKKKSKKSKARLTTVQTAHGNVSGPFFMPIATKGAVKNLDSEALEQLDPQIVLSNTYHLMLAPGSKRIKKAGGLHRFMNWRKPILTDSGGFQVFSLSKIRKITEDGVLFSDPLSGARHLLTPERSMEIQQDLGVDIAMCFDDVIGYPATKAQTTTAMERTHRWAQRCARAHRQHKGKQQLFGIVQGGIYEDLRKTSAAAIASLDFDGIAIGGVAVGEPRESMHSILSWTVPLLPEKKPRYLMGLGKPEEIVAAVKQGIDMFDCVIPTREARHGRLYFFRKNGDVTKKNFYTTINITNTKFATDFTPLDEAFLKMYSKAYLNHLFKTKEMLAMRFATIHNLWFYLTLMKKIRTAITQGKL